MLFPSNFFPYSGHSGRNRSTKLSKVSSPGRSLDPSGTAFMVVVNESMRAHALSSAIVSQMTTFFEDKTPSRQQGQSEQLMNHHVKTAALELDALVSLHNRRCGLYIKKRVTSCKQFISPMMDKECITRRVSASTNARQLQVITSNVLALLLPHVGTLVTIIFARIC